MINTSPFIAKLLGSLAVCFVCCISCKKDEKTTEPQTTPFKKNELIIIYPPNLTQGARNEVRKKLLSGYQIQQTQTCICDPNLELVIGEGVQRVVNDSSSVRSSTSHTVLVNNSDQVIVSKNVQFKNPVSEGLQRPVLYDYALTRGPVRVAVIDSGLDTLNYFTASSYTRFLLPSSLSNYSMVGITNPSLINRSQYFGWNFIENNQNIMDQGSLKHDTHVTGLILAQAKSNGPEILPLKTSDSSNTSELNNVLCALRFAELAKANIVNASWGYYGTENAGLRDALNRLATSNILVITSAGNDNLDISTTPHYPASFSNLFSSRLDNIITATTATDAALCSHNNYSTAHVDVGVAGQGDNCTFASPFFPGASAVRIAGRSSFAAAVMTGLVARNYPGISLSGSLSDNALNTVLSSVPASPALSTKIKSGKRVTQ